MKPGPLRQPAADTSPKGEAVTGVTGVLSERKKSLPFRGGGPLQSNGGEVKIKKTKGRINMNVKVKSEVNARGLVVWPIVDEDTEACGAAVEFGERLKNISDQLQSNTQSAASDGVVVETYTGTGTGNLALGVSDLLPSEETLLFGRTVASGNVVITTGKEKTPCVRTAFITDRSDGKVNLYKYFKVKYAPYERSTQQVNESGQATFTTLTVNGTYFQSQSSSVEGLKAEVRGVDPTTEAGAAFIANWMANPDFIGGNAMMNTSTISVDGTTVLSGATGTVGDATIITGSASGGTTPYTYSYYYKKRGSNAWMARGEGVTTAMSAITPGTVGIYDFKCIVKDANDVAIEKTWEINYEAAPPEPDNG